MLRQIETAQPESAAATTTADKITERNLTQQIAELNLRLAAQDNIRRYSLYIAGGVLGLKILQLILGSSRK